MNKCPECGVEFEPGTRFCSGCGVDLEKEFIDKPVCPRCGKEFPAGTKFCDEDGIDLVPKEMMTPKCIICKKAYTDGTKFCPDDGGMIIPEALHRRDSQPFDMGNKLSDADFNQLIAMEYSVKSSEYIRRGWELLTKNIGIFIGYTALTFAVFAFLSFIPILGWLTRLVIGSPIYAGFFIVAFKMLNKGKVEFSDFFRGFTIFLPLFLAGLLTTIFTGIGYFLLIVPGIYLMVAYVLVIPLIVDKQIDFWQAMEVSRRFVTRNWFPFFGFFLLLVLINILGCICLIIGLLVTVPLSACAIACAYQDTIGLERSEF